MANITLALPESVHRIVRKHKEILWSEIVRVAIIRHAAKLEIMEILLRRAS